MEAIIWGAGNIGKSVLYSISKEWKIHCFVDNDRRKVGKKIANKEIRAVEYLQETHCNVVIIANTAGKSIKKYLEENCKNICVIDYLHEGLFDNRIGMLNLLIEEIEANKIEGSVGEAGVYKGFFTHYLNKGFKNRRLFLFDTFTGFDEQDVSYDKKNDLTNTDSTLFIDTSMQEVKSNLLYPQNVVFKKGYFPDTTQDIQNERYCFASIDFDLYKPIKAAILYFYTNLSKGGYIMIHDYNNEDFKGVKKAIQELKSELPFSYVPIHDGGGSVVISK